MNNDSINEKKLLVIQEELLNEIKNYSLSELYFFNLKNILEIYSLGKEHKTWICFQSVYTILLREQKRWNKQNYLDKLTTIEIQDFLILMKIYSISNENFKDDKFIKHLSNMKNYKNLLKKAYILHDKVIANLAEKNNFNPLDVINIISKYGFKFQMLKQSSDISWFYSYDIFFKNDYFKNKFQKNFNTDFLTNIYFSTGFSLIISIISNYNLSLDKNYYDNNFWLIFIDKFINYIFKIIKINQKVIENYTFNFSDINELKTKINIENQDFLIFNNLFNFYRKPFIKINNKISLISFSDYNYILTEGALSYLYLLENEKERQNFHKEFENHIFKLLEYSQFVKNNKLNVARELSISNRKNYNLVSSDITLWNNEAVLFIEIKWTKDKIWKNTKENCVDEIHEFKNRHSEKGGAVEQLNRIEKIYKFSQYNSESINLSEKMGLPIFNDKIKIYKIVVFREMLATNEFSNDFRLNDKIICFSYVDFCIIIKNFNGNINKFIEILENKILKKSYNEYHNVSLWQKFIVDKTFLSNFLQKYISFYKDKNDEFFNYFKK